MGSLSYDDASCGYGDLAFDCNDRDKGDKEMVSHLKISWELKNKI